MAVASLPIRLVSVSDDVKDMSCFRCGRGPAASSRLTAACRRIGATPKCGRTSIRACGLISKRKPSAACSAWKSKPARHEFICDSLFAGLLQIIRRRVAPSHRHTRARSLHRRGEGAYTAVAGEKLPMKPGDFVVTPAWAWHDHGNLATSGGLLDGLDTRSRASSARRSARSIPRQAADRPAAKASRCGVRYDLIPDEYHSGRPVLARADLSYERTRAALDNMAARQPASGHGFKLRYANPATGKHPFPDMACVRCSGCPAAFFRQSVSLDLAMRLFAVHRGSGLARIGDKEFKIGAS